MLRLVNVRSGDILGGLHDDEGEIVGIEVEWLRDVNKYLHDNDEGGD